MAKSYFLNEKDRGILQRMVTDSVNKRVNAALRGEVSGVPTPSGGYIARPPSGGIPALTRAPVLGTGSGSGIPGPGEFDHPGSALCTIHKIILDDKTFEIQPLGLTEQVFNLTPVEVKEDWITIQRDKFGRWISVRSAGFGSSGGESFRPLKEGVLAEDLLAASAGAEAPSTANLKIFTWNETAVEYEDSGETETVTNRLTEVGTIPSGTWMGITKVDDSLEWRPIFADCGPTNLFLGTGTGTFPGGELGLRECDWCLDNVMSQCWQFTISGVISGLCTLCDEYNGTFTMKWFFPCQADSVDPVTCEDLTVVCATTTTDRRFAMDIAGSGMLLSAVYSGGSVAAGWEDLNPFVGDCTSAFTLTKTFENVDNVQCSNFPDTITVTPIPCPC